MITQIRKDYRSEEGLVALMGLLKVDGIKIGAGVLDNGQDHSSQCYRAGDRLYFDWFFVPVPLVEQRLIPDMQGADWKISPKW